jgi:hypothetical protein
MCIIADIVKSVDETKIVCCHVGYVIGNNNPVLPGQLVVYSASVGNLAQTNAFILPVYNPGNDTSKIIPLDFSLLRSFITDIGNIYEKWYPTKRPGNLTRNASTSYNVKLPVSRVGNYNFSVVPSKNDFELVDKSVLKISDDALVSIKVHNDNYSFVVYQFYATGLLDVEPFGYVCPSFNEQIIVPTIHGHPHEGMTDLGTGYVPNMYINFGSNSFEDHAEYDHVIYALIKTDHDKSKINHEDVKDFNRVLREVKKDYNNNDVRLFVPLNCVYKKEIINGLHENRNLLITPYKTEFLNDIVQSPVLPPSIYSNPSM